MFIILIISQIFFACAKSLKTTICQRLRIICLPAFRTVFVSIVSVFVFLLSNLFKMMLFYARKSTINITGTNKLCKFRIFSVFLFNVFIFFFKLSLVFVCRDTHFFLLTKKIKWRQYYYVFCVTVFFLSFASSK